MFYYGFGTKKTLCPKSNCRQILDYLPLLRFLKNRDKLQTFQLDLNGNRKIKTGKILPECKIPLRINKFIIEWGKMSR